AFAVRGLMRDPRLMNAAPDREGNELLMPLAAGLAVIDLRDEVAVFVAGIGVDARKGANPPGSRPGARALAVGDRDALPALDRKQHFASRDHKWLQRLHASSLASAGSRRTRPLTGCL